MCVEIHETLNVSKLPLDMTLNLWAVKSHHRRSRDDYADFGAFFAQNQLNVMCLAHIRETATHKCLCLSFLPEICRSGAACFFTESPGAETRLLQKDDIESLQKRLELMALQVNSVLGILVRFFNNSANNTRVAITECTVFIAFDW